MRGDKIFSIFILLSAERWSATSDRGGFRSHDEIITVQRVHTSSIHLRQGEPILFVMWAGFFFLRRDFEADGIVRGNGALCDELPHLPRTPSVCRRVPEDRIFQRDKHRRKMGRQTRRRNAGVSAFS